MRRRLGQRPVWRNSSTIRLVSTLISISSTWALRAGTGPFRDLQPYFEGRIRQDSKRASDARVGTVGTSRGNRGRFGARSKRHSEMREERRRERRILPAPGCRRHGNRRAPVYCATATFSELQQGQTLTRRQPARSLHGRQPLIARECSRPHHPVLPGGNHLRPSRGLRR